MSEKILGIFDSNLNSNPFGGKSLRVINIFQRLRQQYHLKYFPIISEGEIIPQYIKETFENEIYPIYLDKGGNPLSGRMKGLLSVQPGYNFAITNHKLYKNISSQIEAQCIKHSISLIHIFDFYIASFFMELKKTYPVIWDIGDSFWLIYKRKNWFSRFLLNTSRVKNYEFEHIKIFDRTIFVGEEDFRLYPEKLKSKLTLIPLGVCEDFLNYFSTDEEIENSIIYTGNMSFPPNIDAVLHFYFKIFPLVRRVIPDLKWFIVGTNPEKIMKIIKSDPNIIITGRVEDIRPYIARSKVYIAPIRQGGGMKNKLLEAMALGKTIVAYERAVEGFKQGYNIKISSKPEIFALNIVDSLKESDRRNRVNENFIRENYIWEMTAKKYQELYKSIEGNRA